MPEVLSLVPSIHVKKPDMVGGVEISRSLGFTRQLASSNLGALGQVTDSASKSKVGSMREPISDIVLWPP